MKGLFKFSKILKDCRLVNSLSRAELIDLLFRFDFDVELSTLSRWERGLSEPLHSKKIKILSFLCADIITCIRNDRELVPNFNLIREKLKSNLESYTGLGYSEVKELSNVVRLSSYIQCEDSKSRLCEVTFFLSSKGTLLGSYTIDKGYLGDVYYIDVKDLIIRDCEILLVVLEEICSIYLLERDMKDDIKLSFFCTDKNTAFVLKRVGLPLVSDRGKYYCLLSHKEFLNNEILFYCLLLCLL